VSWKWKVLVSWKQESFGVLERIVSVFWKQNSASV
jgi:hypothetical protein